MFGSILKNLRSQKGLSQEHIAEELHVVRQTVSKWENGLSSPSIEQVIDLSRMFGVSTALLLGMTDEFTSTPQTAIVQTEKLQNHSAAAKKNEMIAAIANRLEELNEAGATALFNLIMLFPDKEHWKASTSPERLAELEAIEVQCEQERIQAAKEAQQTKEATRKQLYLDHARMFNAIDTVDVPTRYDLCVGEIRAIDFICGGISRCFPDYAYSVACKYFKYGFVKGTRYATACAKKKQMQKKSNLPVIEQ